MAALPTCNRPLAEPVGDRHALQGRPSLFEDLHVLGALSGVAALMLAWSFPLWGAAWEITCPLREITGIPCPTCYGTRAMLALVAGDWWRALWFNPLVGVAGIGLFAYVPWATITVLGNGPRPRVSPVLAARLAWAAAGLVAANWIYLLAAHG